MSTFVPLSLTDQPLHESQGEEALQFFADNTGLGRDVRQASFPMDRHACAYSNAAAMSQPMPMSD